MLDALVANDVAALMAAVDGMEARSLSFESALQSLAALPPDLLARRKPWNKRADDAVSLPTEIWRETIARHQRTREVRARLAAGELKEVGDLITWNLNIRQFAQDLIEGCTDVALLKSFWFNLAGRLPRHSNPETAVRRHPAHPASRAGRRTDDRRHRPP